MRMMAMAFPFENLDFGRLWWMAEGTSILHQVQALNDICAFLWQRICQNQVLYLLQVQYGPGESICRSTLRDQEQQRSGVPLRMGVAPPSVAHWLPRVAVAATSLTTSKHTSLEHTTWEGFGSNFETNRPAGALLSLQWVVLSSTWSEFSDLGTTVKHVVDLEGFFLSDKVIVRRVNACNPVHTSTWLSIVPSIGPQCMISGDPSGRSVPSLPVPVYTWHRTLTVTKGFTRMRPRDPSRSSDGPFG